jgi:hypothetical protein
VKLESLYSHNRACIDASDFPQLKSITISNYDVECSPEEAVSKLLAPRVTNFGWSFTLCGQTQPNIYAFGQQQADWLTKFVQIAQSKKSVLRHIHIDYQPEFWDGFYQDLDDKRVEYPFHRIDRLATSLALQDIKLTYELPWLRREDFESRAERSLSNSGSRKGNADTSIE